MCLSLLIFKGFRVVDVTGLVWFVIQDDEVVCVANASVLSQISLRRCHTVSYKAKTAFKNKDVFNVEVIEIDGPLRAVNGIFACQNICYDLKLSVI